MLPPGLRIYVSPRVTLTFDVMKPKPDHFVPGLPSTTFANWHRNRLIRFQNIVFTSLITDERTYIYIRLLCVALRLLIKT